MAYALLEDGREIALGQEEVRRILYALTNLQQTSLGSVQNCVAILNDDRDTLWRAQGR